MSTQSTLTQAEVLKLTRIAKNLEFKYGYPVDIEFVIQNNVLYIVQIRPLEARKKDPAFINQAFLKTINPENRFDGEMIGVGHAHATIVERIDQLIFDTTLKKAVDNQLLPSLTNAKNHLHEVKGIIVTAMAPATSHEATIAGGHNKPVFVFPEIGKIKAAFAQGKQLIIDPQRGSIVIIDLKNHVGPMIERGWFAHPIPSKISITDLVNLPNITEDQFKKLIDKERFNKIIALSKEKKATELLAIIKHDADLDLALNATLALYYKAVATIQKFEKEPLLINKTIKKQLVALKGALNSAIHDQINVLREQKVAQINGTELDGKARLLRLYPASSLEALLKQLPKSGNLHDFSIGSLLKTEKLEQKILKEYQNDLGIRLDPANQYTEQIIQYAKAAPFALTPELANGWKRFVSDFQSASQEQNEAFAEMILTLAELDTLPLWINTSVNEALHKSNFNEIYETLINEYQGSHEFITSLKEISNQCNAFPVESFASPQVFDKQWELFDEILKKTVMNQEFIEQFEASSRLGKLTSTAVLRKMVDTFDNSIKALTGSTEYKKDTLHAKRFKIMAERYFDFFEHLCSIPSLKKDLNMLCARVSSKEPIQDYCDTVRLSLFRRIDSNIESTNQFEPSFNVPGATIGSQALWSRNFISGKPITLESLFSLTHQNLLVFLSTIAKKENLEKGLPLPISLNNFKETMAQLEIISKEQGFEYKLSAHYIGTSFDQNMITLSYNIPLRNHSNTFNINYDLLSKKIFFETVFMGHATDIWKQYSEVALIMSHYFDMPLSKQTELDTDSGSVSFGFELKTEEHQEIIAELLKIFAQFSCLVNDDIPHIYEVLHQTITAIQKRTKSKYDFFSQLTNLVIDKNLADLDPEICFNSKAFWEIIFWHPGAQQYFKHHLEQRLLDYYQTSKKNRSLEMSIMEKIVKIISMRKKLRKKLNVDEAIQKSESQEFCKKFLAIIDSAHLEKADFYYVDNVFKAALEDLDNPKEFIMTLINHPKPEVRATGILLFRQLFEGNFKYGKHDYRRKKGLINKTPEFVKTFIQESLPQEIITRFFSDEVDLIVILRTLQLYKVLCNEYQLPFDDTVKQKSCTLNIAVYPASTTLDAQKELIDTIEVTNENRIEIINMLLKTQFEENRNYEYFDANDLYQPLLTFSYEPEQRALLIDSMYQFLEHNYTDLFKLFASDIDLTITEDLFARFIADNRCTDIKFKKRAINNGLCAARNELRLKKIEKEQFPIIERIIDKVITTGLHEQRTIDEIRQYIIEQA